MSVQFFIMKNDCLFHSLMGRAPVELGLILAERCLMEHGKPPTEAEPFGSWTGQQGRVTGVEESIIEQPGGELRRRPCPFARWAT